MRISAPAARAERGDRLGNRAHAANRVAPHAGLAVDLAEAVVEQHVSRAGRKRRSVGADDAVERERGLDDIALEPGVEKIRRTLGEKIGDEAPALDIEAAQPPREPRALDQFGDAAADVGRRAQDEIAQHVGGLLQRRVVGRQALGVAGRERRDGALPVGEAVGHDEAAGGIDRPEIRDRTLDDAQAVVAKLEVADHLRIEQAYRVGCDGVAKTRREGLGHGGAADHIVGLEHDHAEPSPRQIGGAGQRIVPAADQGDVVGGCGRCCHEAQLGRVGGRKQAVTVRTVTAIRRSEPQRNKVLPAKEGPSCPTCHALGPAPNAHRALTRRSICSINHNCGDMSIM